MKGLVGIPHTGTFHADFVQYTLFGMKLVGQGTNIAFLGQALTHIARENLAFKCKSEMYNWLLFIDSDMIVPGDLIERWFPKIGQYGIICAPAFKRFTPHTPCFYEEVSVDKGMIKIIPFKDWPKDKMFEAQASGASCMMISTEVFHKMSPPYFYPYPTTGEDITFCIKAREAGFKVWIDPTVRIGHLSTRPVYEEDYRRAYEGQ